MPADRFALVRALVHAEAYRASRPETNKSTSSEPRPPERAHIPDDARPRRRPLADQLLSVLF